MTSRRDGRGEWPGQRHFIRCIVALRGAVPALMFGSVLLVLALTVMPSPGQARSSGLTQLAYVVSPPPATREVMPRYLPKLPKDPEPIRSVPLNLPRGAQEPLALHLAQCRIDLRRRGVPDLLQAR